MKTKYNEPIIPGFPTMKSNNGKFCVLPMTEENDIFGLILTDPNPLAMRDRILLIGTKEEIEAFGKGIVFGATNYSKLNNDSIIQATKQRQD